MNVDLLTGNLFDEAMATSLLAFRPELSVCATILALLLVKMFAPRWKNGGFVVALAGTLVALYFASVPDGLQKPVELFTGMLLYDTFGIFMRGLLLFFAALFACFVWISRTPERDSAGEFYVLILGAVLGMCLMVSANHMLIVFLGIEMASVPSYALAGFAKHKRRSSEAALKFAVFGAGAAGVMLYGISLLVGTLGSAHLPTMARQLAGMLQQGLGDQTVVLLLAGLMVLVGLAFKLSLVPFHFWTPDVFEGTTAEVAGFLSIASKAAALALLVRLGLGFGYVDRLVPPDVSMPPAAEAVVLSQVESAESGEKTNGPPEENFDQALAPSSGPIEIYNPHASRSSPTAALEPVRKYIVGLLALLAAVTCTFGNLAAYGQTNLKRLFAYSTIAHAGYMVMPVAAAVAMVGHSVPGARMAVAAMAFYVAIYLFMNLGAFATVAFVRNASGSEEIADYAGLMGRSTGVAVCMTIILFSLVGLPPLAGFPAKFAIFAAVFHGYQQTQFPVLLAVLLVGVLNTVLSLFYYLRVVRIMSMTSAPEDRPAPRIPLGSLAGLFCMVVAVPILILGTFWADLFGWAEAAASSLLP